MPHVLYSYWQVVCRLDISFFFIVTITERIPQYLFVRILTKGCFSYLIKGILQKEIVDFYQFFDTAGKFPDYYQQEFGT